MADHGAAARRPALDAPPVSRQDVSIRISPAEARFSLRVPMAAAAAAMDVAGFPLNMAINRVEARDRRWSARLGPNEWLLGGPAEEGEAIMAEIAAAFAGAIHALTDISHRHVAFDVSGAEATAILNAGCPLDLSNKAFPQGSATRTVLGKAEVILMRPASSSGFRLECWRSFAEYVHAFLVEAASDCPDRG